MEFTRGVTLVTFVITARYWLAAVAVWWLRAAQFRLAGVGRPAGGGPFPHDLSGDVRVKSVVVQPRWATRLRYSRGGFS
jgi:hypothetical protein